MKILKDEISVAMVSNNQTYVDYLDRLRLLSTSIFSWKNLDKVAGFGAERFLEQALFERGRACFVKDKEYGFLMMLGMIYSGIGFYSGYVGRMSNFFWVFII